MFTVFLLRICVYCIDWSCYFFHIINVCHDLFNELCKYIMYNYRLMLISICWCISCCKIDDWHHNICDICVYCMILFNFWIFFEYFQDYKCSSPIGRFDFRLIFSTLLIEIGFRVVSFLLLKFHLIRFLHLYHCQLVFWFLWLVYKCLYCISVIY